MGRDPVNSLTQCQPFCFNPRARMGRDHFMKNTKQFYIVSIHAPAWGATLSEVSVIRVLFCFNPRARMGRDFIYHKKTRRKILFQSTRPHGARLISISQSNKLRKVSIHAPAWGATAGFDNACEGFQVSIHAPAWGATSASRNLINLEKFQSTRPHGARPLGMKFLAGENSFNPRARMGRDLISACRLVGFKMFQSTRPHGARQSIYLN